MIEGAGYSIWIEPTGDLLKRYQGVVNSLAQRFGTPEFMPHLTLVGGIDQPKDQVIERTSELAWKTKPFEIDLTGEIECRDGDWTRTMVMLAQLNPPLAELYHRSLRLFRLNRREIGPHISLMYSEGLAQGLRDDAVAKLDIPGLTGRMEVAALSLIDTNGPIENWKKVQDFPLIYRD